MRYSSSKVASGSGSSYGSPSGGGYSYNATSGRSNGGNYTGARGGSSPSYFTPVSSIYSTPPRSSNHGLSGLVLKKDGTPDMRYSSSKAAVASQSHSTHLAPSSHPTALHTKKDGTLDMRYSSSNVAVGQQSPASPSQSAEVHTKKDGTLDMRYSSSRVLVGTRRLPSNDSQQAVHLKKDGTPDMRYKTSQALVENMGKLNLASPRTAVNAAPRLKKDGTLDMRFKANREAVQRAELATHLENAREKYWEEQRGNADFIQQWNIQQHINIIIPRPRKIFTENEKETIITEIHKLETVEVDNLLLLPRHIPMIPSFELSYPEGTKELGRGAFGVVVKAMWKDRPVAVKQLYLVELTKKEKKTFQREVNVMALLGKHDNIVEFYGYSLDPLSIIMEHVELGSLSYVLHYCQDKEVEAQMADGRVKKNVLVGVVAGMCLLHEVGIVHGDLKPQNVLLARDFTAKLTDFGMSVVTGKAATMSTLGDGDSEDAYFAGGTAGYMAPELLDSAKRNTEKSDVYSFGILLNEVVTEEEPYSDQVRNFAGRGPYAAVNYARLGNRPRIRKSASKALVRLIESCWNEKPELRLDFEEIENLFMDTKEPLVIPNSF